VTPAPITTVPDHLRIEPWIDPVVDRLGHDPRSAYVETFWLGILGPSTTWLVRRMVAGFDEQPSGYDLEPIGTARALGIGHRSGTTSPFVRSLARAERFGITRTDGACVSVRRRLPPLSRRLLERLPHEIQAEHRRWQERELRDGVDEARTRARHLALNLLRLGEDAEGAEVALHRRRIHPAMAADATRWALTQLSEPSHDSPAEITPLPVGSGAPQP